MFIIVTGAAGFIGSHICNYYANISDDIHVMGIDDFSSSSSKSRHFKNLISNDNFCFYNISIENKEELFKIFSSYSHEKFQNSIIYNFACPASPPIYQQLPIKTLMTCVQGTKNVLELANKFNMRVIHASTSEVYGDPNITPQKETYWGNVNCYGERSNYDEGKRCAETLCYEYKKLGVDVRIARIFNTYGPNMDVNDGRVITNFVKQAIKGEGLTIYGKGTQTRSFCYIDDLLEGIILLSTLNINDYKGPVNLGNPKEFRIIDLAYLLNEKYFNNELVFEFCDLPKDDPMQRKPDITLAKNILNWSPKVNLEVGLMKMISYMKGVINA